MSRSKVITGKLKLSSRKCYYSKHYPMNTMHTLTQVTALPTLTVTFL